MKPNDEKYVQVDNGAQIDLGTENEFNLAGLGQSLPDALAAGIGETRLNIGCVAAHGIFACEADSSHTLTPEGKPATSFLFELIARLQNTATVPMIDIRAYAKWLERTTPTV